MARAAFDEVGDRREVRRVKEVKETLQRIADSLEQIAISLDMLERKYGKESTEEFYKNHGITQTFS